MLRARTTGQPTIRVADNQLRARCCPGQTKGDR